MVNFHKTYLIKFSTFSKFTSFYDEPFFKSGFTPCKAEEPLRGMGLQEKEGKDENRRRELFRKNPRKKCAY